MSTSSSSVSSPSSSDRDIFEMDSRGGNVDDDEDGDETIPGFDDKYEGCGVMPTSDFSCWKA